MCPGGGGSTGANMPVADSADSAAFGVGVVPVVVDSAAFGVTVVVKVVFCLLDGPDFSWMMIQSSSSSVVPTNKIYLRTFATIELMKSQIVAKSFTHLNIPFPPPVSYTHLTLPTKRIV